MLNAHTTIFRFIDHLHTMFAEPTGWDVDHNYSPDHLEVSYKSICDLEEYICDI